MAPHRSRLCHLVVDCDDLDTAVAFWSAVLGATDEPVNPASRHIYRRLRLPDSEIRLLLQRTDDEKTSKERMHLDLETDDVEAEVQRLEKLGATRSDHQQERGFDFWVPARSLRQRVLRPPDQLPGSPEQPPTLADRQQMNASASPASRTALGGYDPIDRGQRPLPSAPGHQQGEAGVRRCARSSATV